MENRPLVSVIMPSLNQVEFISQSIETVLKQFYQEIELIVADGGSTDGTVELLKDWATCDDRLNWSSQMDSGPAEALNRALGQVSGTIVGWLNSDDLYVSDTVARAVKAFSENPNWIMLYGHGRHVDSQGRFISSYPTLPPAGPLNRFASSCFICQPTVFFKRSMHVLLGDLDINLKTAFDFDYWLRAFRAFPERIGFVDEVQAESRLHDACITKTMRRTVALEGLRVVARHLGHAPIHWITTYIEELLDADTEEFVNGDLREHILMTLSQAENYLKRDDFSSLLRQIEMDWRLNCRAHSG